MKPLYPPTDPKVEMINDFQLLIEEVTGQSALRLTTPQRLKKDDLRKLIRVLEIAKTRKRECGAASEPD